MQNLQLPTFFFLNLFLRDCCTILRDNFLRKGGFSRSSRKFSLGMLIDREEFSECLLSTVLLIEGLKLSVT